MKRLFVLAITLVLALPATASAQDANGRTLLSEAQTLYQSGQYFSSARYAFSAADVDPSIRPEAYAWVTAGLSRSGLAHSAAYFFIRTLQTGSRPAIRRVLQHTDELLDKVGPDVLRKYLVRHTTLEDYDSGDRSAYVYALAKDALLDGKNDEAIRYASQVSRRSMLYPYALQLRGSARAIAGQKDAAVEDFEECAGSVNRKRAEGEDLKARCDASHARVLYESGQFDTADRIFDRVPKSSFVWPDILFEQAWNSFARSEYNRSLGKLVSYKSPALEFVFNSEVDVLRAQSFLALCLYDDANKVINEFNPKYSRVGDELKRFLERNERDLGAFYDLGKAAVAARLSKAQPLHWVANRFVRGPYFTGLLDSEAQLESERAAIRRFEALPGVPRTGGTRGFPGFLEQVLQWRKRTILSLGGAFVKNSMLDHHSILIADFEKMAFIKLEMLGRARQALMSTKASTGEERGRGNRRPDRRDDQYYWSFNGEFWNDELGDYVFGLESECK